MRTLQLGFVSIGNAAKTLGTHIETIHEWERQGTLKPAYITPGGHRRYSIRQLEEFLRDNKEQKMDLPEDIRAKLDREFQDRCEYLRSMTDDKVFGDVSDLVSNFVKTINGKYGYFGVTCEMNGFGNDFTLKVITKDNIKRFEAAMEKWSTEKKPMPKTVTVLLNNDKTIDDKWEYDLSD